MITLYRRFPFLQRQTPSTPLLFCLFFTPSVVPKRLPCLVPVVLMPVGGCTPDRNDPPTRKQGNSRQKTEINKRFTSGECRSSLCRSGVAPPTGTIHPRESRATADRKQKSIKRFTSGEYLSDPLLVRNFYPVSQSPTKSATIPESRRDGRVVMQRPAKPCTPVQFRLPPPRSHLPTFKVSKPRKKNNRPPGWWNWQTQGT